MSFHVGQKVVCIKGERRGCMNPDRVYTCLAVEPEFLQVDCCADTSEGHRWYRWRFRPAVERKTDISIFTAMLTGTKITEKAK